MDSKYRSKFTSDQIRKMRKLVEDGYALHYVARKLGCCANAVCHHTFDLIPPKKVSKIMQKRYMQSSNLTIAKVQKIRELGVTKRYSAVEIGDIFGISPTSALSIIKGKTFRWLPGMTLSGEIVPIEYDFKPKSDLTRGPKFGSKQKVKSGVLLKYAEKYGVKPTTICRRIKKGTLKIKKSELIIN